MDVWHYAWPFLILVAGLLCFAMMMLRGREAARWAIPGSILTMLGLIFIYQNTFDQFQAWSYVWTLIFPTAIGIGQYLEGRWSNRPDRVASGFQMTRIGLILFVIFTAFFELFVNLSGLFQEDVGRFAFPILLIAVGVVLIVGRLFNWFPLPHGMQTPTGTLPPAASSCIDSAPNRQMPLYVSREST